MHTYVVALPKGGSTKTTTAAELVAALARDEQRVLAIDLDQQGNLSTRLGITPSIEVEAVAADVLTGAAPATAATPSPAVPGAWVLPGTHDLAGLEQRPEIISSLRDHLPRLADTFDAVVIDTPPASSLSTLAALAAADTTVAAVACTTEALDQLQPLADVITHRIAPLLNPGAGIDWIVPTRCDQRRLLDREVLEELETRWPGKVTHPVREAVAVRDSYTAALPISLYAPTAPVSLDYSQAMTQITAQH